MSHVVAYVHLIWCRCSACWDIVGDTEICCVGDFLENLTFYFKLHVRLDGVCGVCCQLCQSVKFHTSWLNCLEICNWNASTSNLARMVVFERYDWSLGFNPATFKCNGVSGSEAELIIISSWQEIGVEFPSYKVQCTFSVSIGFKECSRGSESGSRRCRWSKSRPSIIVKILNINQLYSQVISGRPLISSINIQLQSPACDVRVSRRNRYLFNW